jgi:hypothetical protein
VEDSTIPCNKEQQLFESYAKGRNGYYKLDRIVVDSRSELRSAGARLGIHFYSKRAVYPGAGYAVMTSKEAKALGEALIKMAESEE